MREIVLEVRIRDYTHEFLTESLVETSDRVADELTQTLQDAELPASITPKFAFEKDSEVPVDLGN